MNYIEMYGRHSRTNELRKITTSRKNVEKFILKGYEFSEADFLKEEKKEENPK